MGESMDVIAQDAVTLDYHAHDWRAAIREAGRLLTDTGVTDAAYTDAMIASVDEHGPYIVIAPGFALAHARPDASVHRTGVSFVRLAKPVAFGHETNDPVTLVMGLAALDSSEHQQALAAIAAVLADQQRRARLDTAASPREIQLILSGRELGDADAGAAPTAPPSAPGSQPAGERDHAHAHAEPVGNEPPRSETTGTPPVGGSPEPAGAAARLAEEATVPSKGRILAVCGNGVGTSLFLKSTLDTVLDRWQWSRFIDTEATDTISARGKAGSADLLLTSRAIADALGDVDAPVEIIEDFTSAAEIDAALRRWYAV